MRARLWVTGLGLVTPLGAGVDATWAALVRGDRAIGPVTLFDASTQRVALAAEVRHVPRGLSRAEASCSRTSAMALAAAEEALQGARLDVRSARVGLVIGSTTGGMFETESLLARLHAERVTCGPEGLREMMLHPLTATGDYLDDRLGPFARVRMLASACSSGANAIVVATAWLASGEVDAVVAGGADGLCRLTLSGFNALCALDPGPCRPFDRRRCGTSLGEGAGFLVLESAERARARRVEPVAELAGWAMGSEAHHITNPAPDGAMVAQLIARAIARAGLAPSDVDYVSAHGTGTRLSDPVEAAALGRAFGDEIRRVPVSSSKAQIGHTLGAAGGIEAAITALVVARRMLVPTAGLDEPDPALALVHVPHVGREVPRVRAAVSNAFGFGGMDTVLVFCEPHARKSAPPPNANRAAEGTRYGQGPVIGGAAIFGSCGLLGLHECARVGDTPLERGGRADPDMHLDVTRSRRLDRTARLGAVAVEHALVQAEAAPESTGVVIGSAFGNVEPSGAFLHRVFSKGARSASPAEFPNLVPSSPAGHISIYAGMHGPVFATADLSVSGESAFAEAVRLLAAGESTCFVAGAIDTESDIVDRALSPLFGPAASQEDAARSDLAAAVVIESAAGSRARGGRALARVAQVVEWRGDPRSALGELLGPRGARAEVVLSRSDGATDAILRRTAWWKCDRLHCASAFGEGDALGAVAIAVAAARVGTARAGEVLVLGLAPGRGYAVVLVAP